MLAALEMVDAVVVFDEDTPFELIGAIRPDVLVKGGDYTEASIVGAPEVRSLGRRRRRHSAHAGPFHDLTSSNDFVATDSMIPFAAIAPPIEMRPVTLERAVAPYAEGSCLVSFGATRVLCTASVEDGVPGWRRGRGEGWLTAEYAMLPRATKTRTSRERSQIGGRTQEIQRLIGRSVRAMLDDFRFGEYTLKIDCDVLVRPTAERARRRSPVRASPWSTRSTGWSRAGESRASPVKRRVAGGERRCRRHGSRVSISTTRKTCARTST